MKEAKSDREWEAENDFNSLVSAEEIYGDAKRLAKALKAGERMVAEEQKVLKTKKKIAKGKK